MTSGPFLKFCHNWFSKPYSQHDLQAMYCLNRTPVLPHVIGNSPCRSCHGFWQLDVFRMEPIFKLFAAGFVGNCFNSSGCHCKKVKWWRPKRKNSVTWLSGRLNVVLCYSDLLSSRLQFLTILNGSKCDNICFNFDPILVTWYDPCHLIGWRPP